MSTTTIPEGNHPLGRAFHAISSSVQLLLDHFGLDGAFLLERPLYSKTSVSGRVIFCFGKAIGIRDGDDLIATMRNSPLDNVGAQVTRHITYRAAAMLPSLIYMVDNSNPVWFEVPHQFLVGPIRVLSALSVIPDASTMAEHQLVLFDMRPAKFTSSQVAASLMGVAPLLAKVIEDSHLAWFREQQTSRVLSEAERDPLSGVLNRFGWERALASFRHSEAGMTCSVIVFDLDNLKAINDTAGHASGDAYIRRFGEVLAATSRQGDFLARIGGDEFVMLAPRMTPGAAREFSYRLDAKLIQAGVSASVGYASGTTPIDVGKLVAEADRVMYLNKRRKKSFAMAHLPFGAN